MEIITYKHHSLLKKKGVKKFIKIKKKKCDIVWVCFIDIFSMEIYKIIFFFKRWKYENKKDYDLVTDIFLFKFYSFDI